MNKPAPAPRTDDESASADRVLDHAVGWVQATRSRASALTGLAVAEARLAAVSIVLMAFLGVIAAACLMGAWGLLVAGIVYALLTAGVPVWLALTGMGLLHAVLAVVLWLTVKRLSTRLEFSETRSQLFRARPEADT